MLGVLGAIAMRDPIWKARLENNGPGMRLAMAVFALGLLALTKLASDQLSFGMLTVGYTWIALFYACLLLYALTAPQSWIVFFFSDGSPSAGLEQLRTEPISVTCLSAGRSSDSSTPTGPS